MREGTSLGLKVKTEDKSSKYGLVHNLLTTTHRVENGHTLTENHRIVGDLTTLKWVGDTSTPQTLLTSISPSTILDANTQKLAPWLRHPFLFLPSIRILFVFQRRPRRISPICTASRSSPQGRSHGQLRRPFLPRRPPQICCGPIARPLVLRLPRRRRGGELQCLPVCPPAVAGIRTVGQAPGANHRTLRAIPLYTVPFLASNRCLCHGRWR